MKKRVRARTFQRTGDTRRAFVLSLMRALFLAGKIETTEARAKEIARLAQKVITTAKKENTMMARRELAKMFDAKTVARLLSHVAPNYKERKGGYTRVIKTGRRGGDAARTAVLELVA
ncbi:MAG: 50S ribosomal protein L17 [Candidatus Wildermuthbacteria bacterium]|nr:50S ribosomal protein L17 [Candidatus Wildermuthbacteria bacterium]MBI2121082.1 50S ribosomal protein L17 [Candidatus Wildermuthbacteria bacterium]MBI2647967.1 50S ribosomal protein L17 [Candidatus Wildermuthbacteria bacterium]